MAHLVMLALLLKGKYVKLLNSLQFLPGAELLAALRHPGHEVVCHVSKRGPTSGREAQTLSAPQQELTGPLLAGCEVAAFV